MTHLCWDCGIPYSSESKNICKPDAKTQTKKQNEAIDECLLISISLEFFLSDISSEDTVLQEYLQMQMLFGSV